MLCSDLAPLIARTFLRTYYGKLWTLFLRAVCWLSNGPGWVLVPRFNRILYISLLSWLYFFNLLFFSTFLCRTFVVNFCHLCFVYVMFWSALFYSSISEATQIWKNSWESLQMFKPINGWTVVRQELARSVSRCWCLFDDGPKVSQKYPRCHQTQWLKAGWLRSYM